jgi:NitT/TauT family transport system substrate-binding protein
MRKYSGSGHRRPRSHGTGVLAVALLALLVSACSSPSSDTSTSTGSAAEDSQKSEAITLTVAYNKFWNISPLFVGRQLGYFDDLPNVTVEWVEFDTPSAALAAVAAGDVDVVATPGPTLIQSAASGVSAVGVASLGGESDPGGYSFVTGADSGIEDVAQLRGKTVGVNNYAGNFDLHLRYLLEEAGLDPEKDLNIMPVPISAVIPGVLEGSVDAGAVVGAGALVAEQDARLATVFSSRDIEPIQGQYSFMVLAMSQDLVGEHRPAAVEFLTAYVRSVDHILDQPDDALELWVADTGIEIIKKTRTMNEFPDGGAVQMAGMEFDMELLERYEYMTVPVDLDEVVDDSLLEDARAEVDQAG